MNFKKYNFKIFIIMFLFGCSDTKSEYKYYETGELFSVTEYMEGLKNEKQLSSIKLAIQWKHKNGQMV